MLHYRSIQPPAHLAHLVRFYWSLEGEASAENPFRHKTLADSSAELIFYYKGGFDMQEADGSFTSCSGSTLFGQADTPAIFTTQNSFGLFGTYLYPGAVTQLFGLPSSLITNRHIGLDALIKNEGSVLSEKIAAAKTLEQRATILSHYLSKKLVSRQGRDGHLLQQLKHIVDASGFDFAPDYFGLSRRQFERKFREHSGFSPHTFVSLTRFNALANSKMTGPFSLTDMAYEYGYYDQPHFIRAFKKFSGYSPAYYFRKINTAVNVRATVHA